MDDPSAAPSPEPARPVPMDPRIGEVLAPVLDDMRRTDAPAPRIEPVVDPYPDEAMVMFWAEDGSGAGVPVHRSASTAEQITSAADHAQEWVIEELARVGKPTNWPVCPLHPTTHPLRPAIVAASPVWVCPAERTPITPIGSLPAT